jgi:hypothetical protein
MNSFRVKAKVLTMLWLLKNFMCVNMYIWENMTMFRTCMCVNMHVYTNKLPGSEIACVCVCDYMNECWHMTMLWNCMCVKVLLKQTQVKGCFAIADMWKDTWWRSTSQTPQTQGEGALVCFAPPPYSLRMAHMYWFTLHCVAELSSWWLCANELLKYGIKVRKIMPQPIFCWLSPSQ